MHFPMVIGQQPIINRLLTMLEENRLSHAILLSGHDGFGVLPLAVSFGQLLVSQSHTPAASAAPDLFGGGLFDEPAPEESNPATDQLLPVSPQAAQLLHPDLHFSYPVIPKKSGDKPVSTDYSSEWREFISQRPYGSVLEWLQSIGAENQQGNITAEECNDIIRKLSLKSFSSKYKVLVMWLPEYLGKEGNKLLKLIEEPPADTIFILATQNEEQLLGTILSRCQTIKVPPIDAADLEEALQSRAQLDAGKARQLALISEGSYLEALHLLQHSDEDLNALLRDWLNAALSKGSKQHERFQLQLKLVSTLAGLGRERQKQLLRYLLQLLEQSLRLRILGPQMLHLPPAEAEFAARLNKIAGLGQQKAIVEEVNRSIYHIERNANAKLLFQALTLKMRSIILEKVVTEV